MVMMRSKYLNYNNMYRELFVDYLEIVLPHKKRNSANPKTINDYVDGLSGRIAGFASKYYPEFQNIFDLNFEDAKNVLNRLLNDNEFIEHCKRSHSVQRTAINHYMHFMGYIKFLKENINNNDISTNGAKEGDPYECHNVEYRRDKKLRDEVARERDYTCEICGIKLNDVYGSIANGFIEVHHLDPIHEGERVTTKDDLLCVCSNCHSMLHRMNPILSPEDLKLRMKIVRINK